MRFIKGASAGSAIVLSNIFFTEKELVTILFLVSVKKLIQGSGIIIVLF